MRFRPAYLIGMALQTIPEPRKVARQVLALRPGRSVLWQCFALLAVISAALGVAASMAFPVDPDLFGPFLSDPIVRTGAEVLLLIGTVLAIHRIGRAFGGDGVFDQALLTVIWMQFVLLLLQVLTVLLALFAVEAALLVRLFSIGIGFWILSQFITEMHNFRSSGLVFVGIIFCIMAALFGFSVLMVLIGANPDTAGGL